MAMIFIWACRVLFGENGGVGFILVGCNGRRMALKLVGQDNFGIHGN